MKNYIAIIHKDADSDYGVSFPDFPGCITAGATLDEAKIMAQEALDGHISVALEYGDSIPDAMSLEAAMEHEFAEGALVFFLVGIPQAESKAVRLNISLPGDLVDAVDRFAKDRGMSRSAFLAQAARQAMHKSA